MASGRFLEQPIQLRHDEEEEEELEASDQDSNSQTQSESDASAGGDPRSEDEDTALSSGSEAGEEAPLGDISFGVLAKAQETFDPKPRKRKLAESLEEPLSDQREANRAESFDTRKRAKEARINAPKRTSKHAPTVESARKPVSRKRIIFEPSPALKARDPRFDPTVMSANRGINATEKANKNYSFLSTYQADEVLQLKAQIKKAKDPDVVADLKRQVMSLESKIRNAEAHQREKEIQKRHKEKEKEALRTGQKSKPYYLKEADIKRLAKEERLQSLGKKGRDKAEKRRRKREKAKEARDMPRVRRER
ncbi:uncharacterized protein Z520_10559 [Fonsecaea multimorphosa CBS 102226]|uniref:rRNA biogenesis protein RRP36 n=1 Tax=Fonsecaea multimorphosa CBS 102226 TaxID=1442371 RepID=A0A0D2KAU5_9EURO|nr:uncharacterized protein Z520_10559 [Fonsecaea multimorphosa CBS 102226]KIX93653.1 hypothetical protein Z520_10559 [Fonsecaea multimorphosa CBS 102226]OAL19766.1 hypothetical protein AYO22_09293 [Fonsecaea multimorphosa]